jgi:chemotaxis-related protein WspD
MEPAMSTATPGLTPADEDGAASGRAIIAFRVGARWLALAAAQAREIVDILPAHRVPHRRDARFVGLVNVRGELVPCIDIAVVLGIERASVDTSLAHAARTKPRMVLIEQDGQALAFEVDEVNAVHLVTQEALRAVPPDEPAETGRFTQALVDLPVGRTALIDADLFWYATSEGLR